MFSSQLKIICLVQSAGGSLTCKIMIDLEYVFVRFGKTITNMRP